VRGFGRGEPDFARAGVVPTMNQQSSSIASDYRPTAPWKNLRVRAELLDLVRQFFRQRGFLEVETPLLSADTVVDRHIDPLGVDVPSPHGRPGSAVAMWLQTSPEFAMKRLLAALDTPDAPQAIYQIARAFRSGERGPLHHPEFTLVEWYRVGDDMHSGMDLLSQLCAAVLKTPPAAATTYRDAFERYAGIDPLRAPVEALRCMAERAGIGASDSFAAADRDAWLDLLWSQCVQPHLGHDRPVIVYHYPASQAALARLAEDDPAVAERFELFVAGVELANGYHELLDADVLLARTRTANAARIAAGKQPLKEHSRLLDALRAGLPPCSGAALGFDRLVMLATGATSLDEVVAFPIERA
jgi:lysyl-tRNA synthetase class 2